MSLPARTSACAGIAVAALSALAACSSDESAPWNTNPGVDGHAVYLPLRGTAHDPTGAASTTSCEGCHGGVSFRQFVCIGCHTPPTTDPLHASSAAAGYVPGAVTSADCYRCHPQGTGIAPANHAIYFPIATAAHPPNCGMCHTDPTARADTTKLACVTCHAGRSSLATIHTRVRDYPTSVTAPWCLRCHADGQVDWIAAHVRRGVAGVEDGRAVWPGDGRHATRCFTCHSTVPPDFGGPAGGVPNRPWAQDWTRVGCRASGCH